MHYRIAAAFALIASSSLGAEPVTDLSTAIPLAGSWSYIPTSDGSEARFADASANPQLILHCTRATRRVSLAKPAAAAAPSINVWTSSQTRSIASSFNPATGRLSADLQPYDALLDAMLSSRGRVGVSVGTQPALVVPPWPELARVVEDCRV
ncbi:MAG TPA: hypothetical protein VF750_03725 [Sphingomicrobium sp.]